MKIKCLHICNDLLGSKVHKNLFNHLDRSDFDQTLYYPSRKKLSEKDQHFLNSINAKIIVSKPLRKFHRIFFKNKINYLYKNLKSKTDLSNFDVIHASTMFSDGALALKIYEEFDIPYIIAIRGTDVNLFLKIRVDLRPLAKKILIHASKLVFISQSLEFNFFHNNYINSLNHLINKKSQIIPNGIDSYWLNHIEPQKKITPFKILYIGKFNRNKNVLNLIRAFLLLKKSYPLLELDLVGGGGKEERKVIELSKLHHTSIHYHGPIYDQNELREIISCNHIFAMTSIGETFGLVYVEALTQGLPILFTKNQGIDGTFQENIGEPVKPKSITSISKGLEAVIVNYPKYELDKLNFHDFSWEIISNTYFNLYNSIIKINIH